MEKTLFEEIFKYEWRDITGYESVYKINIKGDVISIRGNSILLLRKDGNRVTLTNKKGEKGKVSISLLMRDIFKDEEIPNEIKKVGVKNLEGELWRPVVGYEDYYSVSNCGRVMATSNPKRTNVCEKLLSLKTSNKGYSTLGLCIHKNRKDVFVHRLVAEAFIPNPENKPYVNHIDSNPSNNKVENLEWCTHSENMQHAWKFGNAKAMHEKDEIHPNSKMDEDKVREVRRLYYEEKMGQIDIAKMFNVNKNNISAIITWRTWFYVDPELKEYYKSFKHTKHKNNG